MYVAKARLWREILQTFTTAPAAGSTPAPARQHEPSGRAALERQTTERLLESHDLGRWSRHKARRSLAAAGARFDKALAAWENTAGPYAARLEGQRARLGAEVAQLEQARTSREEFLAHHPEIPNRLADLDRVIARVEDIDRRRSWDLLKEREHARRLGISHDLDRGYGLEL